MKKIDLQRARPYVIVLVLFVAAAYVYFPPLFEGKIVQQPDISSWRAAANELIQHEEKTGEAAAWTNSMFGGMPSTMILARYKGNFLETAYRFLFLGPRPASYLILALVGFFLLMLALGVELRLAVAGAFAFGLCAYNFQIMMVGHNAKMVAIALMPMVLAASVHAFRGNRLAGATLFGVALAFEILANHPQITYYLAFIILFHGIAELARAWKEGKIASWLKTAALLVLAAGLAAGANVNHLWPAWEYGQQTMRGGSELAGDEKGKSGGLDKSYATSWSYGIDETMNLLIPDFKGGASAPFDEKSATYNTLARSNDPNAGRVFQRLGVYWGPQRFTAGPMYMGAVAVFLFLLGLLVVRGPAKWWIAGVSLLALLLGWGQHAALVSDFFHDHVPLYNKFRVPSMIFVLLQLTIPLLGFLALNAIFRQETGRRQTTKALKIATGIAAGACLLFTLFPSLAGQALKGWEETLPANLQRALQDDRRALLRADAFRSMAFILLAAGTVWLVVTKKMKAKTAAIAIAALVIVDAWTIDKRYLNNGHFKSEREFNAQYLPRAVDKAILQDKALDYRVIDLTTDPFNDSHPSYHHKNIGGYSAAKLQRYQDMIDYFIAPEVEAFSNDLQTGQTLAVARESLSRQKVLNMLNTKYVITNPTTPLENPSALGNAWFARDHEIVNTAREEIAALQRVDPARTAVIREQFAHLVRDRSLAPPSAGDSIRLTSYAPGRLEYRSSTAGERLAVFSEVYYPHGWQVTVDGRPAGHFRVDYILRGMVVPAGKHLIAFHFAPPSIRAGARISTICSGVLLAALLALAIGRVIPGRKKI